jgi:hypothetical protein
LLVFIFEITASLEMSPEVIGTAQDGFAAGTGCGQIITFK